MTKSHTLCVSLHQNDVAYKVLFHQDLDILACFVAMKTQDKMLQGRSKYQVKDRHKYLSHFSLDLFCEYHNCAQIERVTHDTML